MQYLGGEDGVCRVKEVHIMTQRSWKLHTLEGAYVGVGFSSVLGLVGATIAGGGGGGGGVEDSIHNCLQGEV